MKETLDTSLKRKLLEGKRTAGAWLQIASPFTAEIMSHAGFDWLMIDMEHGPGDVLTLISQLQAMNGSGVVPLVRVPANDAVQIKRILDAGAYGVLIPHVKSKEDAEAAVQACRYPPEGIRGISGSPRAAGYGGPTVMERLSSANERVLVILAIETAEAVSTLDQMLEVDGIDVFFIGPRDLATSMGHFNDPNQPQVQEAIAAIEAKVLGAGRVLATVGGDWEQARRKYDKGYQMLTLMSDGVSLGKMAVEKMARFHETFPDG